MSVGSVLGSDGGLRFVFFFQAEDGIRDLVRSRGLGDVYKRQMMGSLVPGSGPSGLSHSSSVWGSNSAGRPDTPRSVSYTHLTLPTSDLV